MKKLILLIFLGFGVLFGENENGQNLATNSQNTQNSTTNSDVITQNSAQNSQNLSPQNSATQTTTNDATTANSTVNSPAQTPAVPENTAISFDPSSDDFQNPASQNSAQNNQNSNLQITSTTQNFAQNANERPSISVFYASKNYAAIGENMHQKVVSQLLKSGQIAVLDRQSGGVYEPEMALIMSETAASSELLKLGNAIGSDYMLLFRIDGVKSAAAKSTITAKKSGGVEVRVSYRVAKFSTREIVATDTASVRVAISDGTLSEDETALQKVAATISAATLGAIFGGENLGESGVADNEQTNGGKPLNYEIGENGGVRLGF